MKTEFIIPSKHLNGEVLLEISLNYGDLKIISSEKDLIEIDYPSLSEENINDFIELSMINNKLTIKEKKSGNSSFNFGGFGSDTKDIDIVLSLPISIHYKADIKLLNGDFAVENLQFDAKIDSCNGDVGIENVITQLTKLKSLNGDVSINNLKGKLFIEHTNGDTNLKNLYDSSLEVKSLSGDILLDNFHGEFVAENFSGDIKCRQSSLSIVQLKNFSGDIDIQAKFKLQSNATISTLSGDVRLDVEEYIGEKLVTVSSVSGDLKVIGDVPQDKIKTSGSVSQIAFVKPMINGIFKSIRNSIPSFKSGCSADTIKPTQQKEEEKEQSNENVIRIKKMVNEGKISLEESKKLLLLIEE